MKSVSGKIRSILHETGFHLVGFSPATQPPKSYHLRKWLSDNFHGTMHWMENHFKKRTDIQQFFPGARSVISVGHNYYSSHPVINDPETAKISRYARGKDYHKVIKKKLKSALRQIKLLDANIQGRICVDTAPFMDKLWAEQAGIGWQGKHTNIISREYGSWIFLGAIVVNTELEYDAPAQDFCGSCTACIDACPTNAIPQPYLLDASRCISYLTIEHRDAPLPAELESQLHNWIFGCDICQDVCPWNRFQQETDEPAYQPLPGTVNPDLNDLVQLSAAEFSTRFNKTPMNRAGHNNLIRNVKANL